MVTIKIIIGSTRPGRFGPKAAQWVYDMAKGRSDAQFMLVDLKEINLPFLDEEKHPMLHQYEHEHTKRWSRIVEDADGFIFVNPEYNLGVVAPVKNALDFLYAEWKHKPLAFVSYGSSAGGKNAQQQVRNIVANLNMYDIAESVIIVNYRNQMNERGEFIATEQQNKAVAAMIEKLVFWAGQMQRARAELAGLGGRYT
jgi:NAD(P)H-dependent FMN reductase